MNITANKKPKALRGSVFHNVITRFQMHIDKKRWRRASPDHNTLQIRYLGAWLAVDAGLPVGLGFLRHYPYIQYLFLYERNFPRNELYKLRDSHPFLKRNMLFVTRIISLKSFEDFPGKIPAIESLASEIQPSPDND